MSLVITIAQQKGGAGKTMLAANLAAAFAGSHRVALLDIDPQRSLSRWHGLRQCHPGLAGIAFSEVSGWRLAGELDRLQRDYDLLLVDSPPHLDTDARRAIRVAHLVLVPVQPSAPDLWAAEGTMALAKSERRTAALVVNRAPTASKQRLQALAAVEQSGHTTLKTTLGNRLGFAQAFAKGLGVIEAAPKTVAAAEMQALIDRVKEMTA